MLTGQLILFHFGKTDKQRMKFFKHFFFPAFLAAHLASSEKVVRVANAKTVYVAAPKSLDLSSTELPLKITKVAGFMEKVLEVEAAPSESVDKGQCKTFKDQYILKGRQLADFAPDVYGKTVNATKDAILKHHFGLFRLHMNEPCADCMAWAIQCGVEICRSTMCADRVRNRRHHSLNNSM